MIAFSDADLPAPLHPEKTANQKDRP